MTFLDKQKLKKLHQQTFIKRNVNCPFCVLSHSVVNNSCSLPDSFHPWNFFRQEYWSGFPCPPPGDLPNPRIKFRSPSLQTDSLLPEPPGKPKNTGVGSLSLLQGTFLTQESNQGLLQCRQILYQLSYQGSPYIYINSYKQNGMSYNNKGIYIMYTCLLYL